MEHAIFAQTHILVGALPDIRWTRLMALRTGNFMARKLLSNAQAIIAEQSEFEGQNLDFFAGDQTAAIVMQSRKHPMHR